MANTSVTVSNGDSVRRIVISGGTTGHSVTIAPSSMGSCTIDENTPATISIHPLDVDLLSGGHGEEG